MKIAFIFLHPFDGSLGSTVRVKELATSLYELGVESYILSPYENSQQLSEGVKVLSIGGYMNKIGFGKYIYKASRIAYYNRFLIQHLMLNQRLQTKIAKNIANSIKKTLEKTKVDAIQFEQDFSLEIASELKKIITLPIIIDIHNITAEELLASDAIKMGSPEFSRLQKKQAENLKKVDYSLVVSEMMKEYVQTTYNLEPERISVIPPGSQINLNHHKKDYDYPKIVYSGLVNYREHVDLFINSMYRIKEKIPNAEFYITKKGDSLRRIKEAAKKKGVNPKFFWYPRKEDFSQFLKTCDVAVLPSSNDLS